MRPLTQFFYGVILAASQQGHGYAEPLTWHEHRFRNVQQQALDVSCGAATLSSLISNYSPFEMTELELLARLVDTVPKEDQERTLLEGFNLLHFKQAIQTKGLELKAAKISLTQLNAFKSPAMLQIKTRVGFHFVMWHAQISGLHWISDPSRGEMWLSDTELTGEWTGVAAWVFLDGEPLGQASKKSLQAAWLSR